MAPIRRYLKITKYSVLELRIYLDDPTQAESWLLDPRRDVLARVMQAIRPYVLPKLREENQRTKGKSKKAKGVKDVVSEDDFEVAMFLTETNTRHALLTRRKIFRSKQDKIRSNSGKLTGWVTSGEVDDPVTIREEEEDGLTISDFPEARAGVNVATESAKQHITADGTEEAIIVPDEVSEDEGFEMEQTPRSKRKQQQEDNDDKKKLGLTMAYDGFSIYGRVLCLIIKRRGYARQQSFVQGVSDRQMMENWVSTQAAAPDLQMLGD